MKYKEVKKEWKWALDLNKKAHNFRQMTNSSSTPYSLPTPP